MSKTVSDIELTTTAEDVLQFLKDNPKFLQLHPEAVDLLIPPKAASGKGVADFQSYMIQRLKADKEEVLTSTKEIVETSRANMNNQQRIHKAVLMLLEAQNFDEFIQAITMDLATLLDVDISVLVVESNGIQQIETKHATTLEAADDNSSVIVGNWEKCHNNRVGKVRRFHAVRLLIYNRFQSAALASCRLR